MSKSRKVEKKYIPRGLRRGAPAPEYNLRKKMIPVLVAWVCQKIGEDWGAQERAIAGKQ